MTTAEFITAFKTINDISCEELLTAIGVDIDDGTAEMIRLFNSYDNLVKIGNKVISRLNITGNSATLAGHKVADSYATYRFQTELVNRINVTLTITTVLQPDAMDFDTPSIDLDDEDVKDVAKGFGTVEIGGESGLLLDANISGVGVEKFVDMLTVNVEGAVDVSKIVYDKNGNEKVSGLVCTGDVIKITAFDGANYVTEELVIVVVGDTNGDGRISIADYARLSAHFADDLDEDKKMSDAEILAADVNGNGRIDVGDAVRLSYKFQYWETEYDSLYSANSSESSNN